MLSTSLLFVSVPSFAQSKEEKLKTKVINWGLQKNVTVKLGHIVLTLALGVCVSAVYGRYHYAADIWGGMMMAALGCWIARRKFGLTAARS